MKPVLDKTAPIYYVDTSDMIKFIVTNSEMKWNYVCKFIYDKNICSMEDGAIYWRKDDLIKDPEQYNEEQVYWVGAFFDAHPWIENMMIVFND